MWAFPARLLREICYECSALLGRPFTFGFIVKSLSHSSIMFQSLLQICVLRSGLGMVGTEMVTLVSSADILGLRTSIKYVGRSFIQMKRKGSIIVPWSWGTSQLRESSRRIDAWLLRYNLGKNFLGQVVYRQPPPLPLPPCKKLPIHLCVPR